MPIDVYPRKLSFTNGPLDDLWEEQHPVIPIVPFPGGEESVGEKRVLEVPDKIVLADHVPVRLRDFHTDSIVLDRICSCNGILV